MFILVLLSGMVYYYFNFFNKGESVLTERAVPFGVGWVFCIVLYSVFLGQNAKVGPADLD